MKVTEKCSEAIKKKVNSADVLTTVRPTVLKRQPLVPMFYGPLLKNNNRNCETSVRIQLKNKNNAAP